jgi:hypothetical protein
MFIASNVIIIVQGLAFDNNCWGSMHMSLIEKNRRFYKKMALDDFPLMEVARACEEK